jgi:AcrR family transcriptional regulator
VRPMAPEEKHLRADAERNRRRLLEAAEELFGERGLEVGVGEIAQRAGVGRGTLFRHFPSKEHLIAAIVAEHMNHATRRATELLDAADPGEALFEFLDEIVGRQQTDRALFDAVGDMFMSNEEIRTAQAEVLGVLDQLIVRAQAAGEVRRDVGAIDVLMLVKGVCQAASAFQHLDADIAQRHLDLIRAALSAPQSAQPLRGRAPTLEDMERAFAPEHAEPDGERASA